MHLHMDTQIVGARTPFATHWAGKQAGEHQFLEVFTIAHGAHQGEAIGHRPLLMLGVLLIVVGIQFLATGLIGELLVHLNNTTAPYLAARVVRAREMGPSTEASPPQEARA